MAGKKPIKTCPVVIGDMALINLGGSRGGGQYAIVDVGDVPIVAGYNWHLSNGYATRKVLNSEGIGGTVAMHHMIIGKVGGVGGVCVDHINQLKLDNRRSNLRHTTWRKNLLNVSTFTRGGRTFPLGVQRNGKKFSGRIRINGVRKNIGSFHTPEEAYGALQKIREGLIA